MSEKPELEGAHCDTCGKWWTFYEMAETIEEYLCPECASGIRSEDYDEFEWFDDE